MAEVPLAVLEAYNIQPSADVTVLSGGRVNETMLINDGGQRTILQRLAGVYNPSIVEDMAAISEHLTAKDWLVPTPLQTVDGELSVRDPDSRLWRRSSYLDSDDARPTRPTTSLSAAAGQLVGEWQTDMLDFEAAFKYQLPHFHDSDHHAVKLDSYLHDLGRPATYTLAHEFLSLYQQSTNTSTGTERVIHADPKLSNMLFKQGQPFTLIDFDDVMRGSQWIDCGDYLRSVSAQVDSDTERDAQHEAFVTGYHASTETGVSLDEANSKARQATGRIALTLGFRYLCDIVDGSYFTWNAQTHASRNEHHMKRAEVQLAVARYALR